jgi:hypothetical protein
LQLAQGKAAIAALDFLLGLLARDDLRRHGMGDAAAFRTMSQPAQMALLNGQPSAAMAALELKHGVRSVLSVKQGPSIHERRRANNPAPGRIPQPQPPPKGPAAGAHGIFFSHCRLAPRRSARNKSRNELNSRVPLFLRRGSPDQPAAAATGYRPLWLYRFLR